MIGGGVREEPIDPGNDCRNRRADERDANDGSLLSATIDRFVTTNRVFRVTIALKLRRERHVPSFGVVCRRL